MDGNIGQLVVSGKVGTCDEHTQNMSRQVLGRLDALCQCSYSDSKFEQYLVVASMQV